MYEFAGLWTQINFLGRGTDMSVGLLRTADILMYVTKNVNSKNYRPFLF